MEKKPSSRCPHLAMAVVAVPSQTLEGSTFDDYFVIGSNNPDFEDQGGLRESVRRMGRLRCRASMEARGEETEGIVCERCADGVFRVLKKRVDEARTTADLYASSERHRRAEDHEDTGIEELMELQKRREALSSAVTSVRERALKLRDDRRLLADAEADLDRRQDTFCRENNALEYHIEAFRDHCAQAVADDDKRKRHRHKLRNLKMQLDALNPDTASFANIDAYLRAAARDLSRTTLDDDDDDDDDKTNERRLSQTNNNIIRTTTY